MSPSRGAGIALVAILALTAALWIGWLSSPHGDTAGSSAAPGPVSARPQLSSTNDVLLDEPVLDLPPLSPQNDEESREVVRFAREASLGQLASLERMLEVEEPLVVGNAVRALGRLGLFSPGSKYIAYLDDERQRVRAEAVRALGQCGDEDAVPYLQGVLASGDGDLRPLALAALGEIGGERARAALAALEPRDRTEQVFLQQALERAASTRRVAAGGE